MVFYQVIFLIVIFKFISSEDNIREEIDLSQKNEKFDIKSLLEELQKSDLIPNFMAQSTQSTQKTQKSRFLQEIPKLNTCKKRKDKSGSDYYDFFPSYEGNLRRQGDSFKYQNSCNSTTIISLKKLSLEEAVITFDYTQTHYLCYNFFIVGTSNFNKFKFLTYFSKYELILKNLSQDDLDEISVNGIRLFSFCQQNVLDILWSFFKTLEPFGRKNPLDIFHHDPDFAMKAVIDILTRYIGNPPIERDPNVQNSTVLIDENIIKTGDHFAISSVSDYATIMQLGTFAHTTHSAVACRFNNTLYICESSGSGGIRKVPYRQWIEMIKNQNESTAFLPLREEWRSKFDEEKALEWFKTMEGLPWGFDDLIFTFFDTPTSNMPDQIDSEFLLTFMSFFSQYTSVFRQEIILEGLNIRLNTTNLTLVQIVAEASRRNMTFEEILSIPEKDGTIYSDGQNLVCSTLVVAFWKAGGMFSGMEINAAEFTIRDVYELNIFENDLKNLRPQACKDADPDLEYCQIVGKYKLTLPYYNTVTPYSNMNERCPLLPPGQRLEGC